MTNLDLGTQGAKRQTWAGASPRAFLLKLRTDYPDETPEQLATRMANWARNNSDGLQTICVYWVQRTLVSLTQKEEQTPMAMKQRRAETEQKVQKVVEQVRRTVLMDLIMPNDKPLRDCTGKDCLKFGGWLATVGKKVGKSTVGAKMSEADLRSMYK